MSFTADGAFLSIVFDVEPAFTLIWLMTWSCKCVKNAVEDLPTFRLVSSNFVMFLSLVSFFNNAIFSCLRFLAIPGFSTLNFSFSSIARCLARCFNFFRLLSRFLSVFVLSDLPTRSPCDLAKNKDRGKYHTINLPTRNCNILDKYIIQYIPLISSGASMAASLVATGATSSIFTAGILLTIFISG